MKLTYVNAPELLNGVEGNNLLQQLSPVVALQKLTEPNGQPCAAMLAYLATWRLSEPQRPCVHERVLDVEVFRIVKDCPDLIIICGGAGR